MRETRCFMAQTEDAQQRPGALWWSPTADGESCVLLGRLPDGVVVNLSLWELIGYPPDITASPSIKSLRSDGTESWHGWLTDGILRRTGGGA